MIDVSWYKDNHRIILWEMKGVWTLAEYNRAADITRDLMAEVEHPVDVIGDLRETNFMPPNIVMTVAARYREIDSRDSNYGISVLIDANRVIETIAALLDRMPYTKNRFYFAPDFATAEALIKQYRNCADN